MVAQSTSDARPPVGIAVVILLAFLAIGLACIWIPSVHFIEMLGAVTSNEARITIEKGAFYLYGGGIALLALLIDGFYNAVLRQKISQTVSSWVSRVAIIGLIMVPILPALIHYPTAYVLERRGYSECEARSSQWLFVRTIVYTKPGKC